MLCRVTLAGIPRIGAIFDSGAAEIRIFPKGSYNTFCHIMADNTEVVRVRTTPAAPRAFSSRRSAEPRVR